MSAGNAFRARVELVASGFRRVLRMEARDDLHREHHLRVARIAAFVARAVQCGDLAFGTQRYELEIAPHQHVGDRHQLAEHLRRRFGDADVVVERLRHLVDAVQSFEQRQRQDALRLLTVMALQLAPDEQVEFLVRAAQLDVGLQRDGVVALRERIQELVNGDWLLFRVPFREVVALEHPRDRVFRGQADHAIRAECCEPLRVERDLGLRAIEDEECLIRVRLRVDGHFVGRERRTRYVAPCRIADQRREIADQENDMVTEVLQLAQLVELHGVAQMQVGACRIEAFLDHERLAAREFRAKLAFDEELVGAAPEDGDVMIDVEAHGRGAAGFDRR
jgi:hypothetical protein